MNFTDNEIFDAEWQVLFIRNNQNWMAYDDFTDEHPCVMRLIKRLKQEGKRRARQSDRAMLITWFFDGSYNNMSVEGCIRLSRYGVTVHGLYGDHHELRGNVASYDFVAAIEKQCRIVDLRILGKKQFKKTQEIGSSSPAIGRSSRILNVPRIRPPKGDL